MNDDDTQYGAYTPTPEDYNTFDAREEEQDRRGWLFLAASAVVFVLFVAVVYNTFQLGVRERGQSPVITADAEPYRVAPENPGGYEAPDQDLSAYALREGEGGAATGTDPVTAPARDVQEEPLSAPETTREMPALQVETANADQMDTPSDTPAETVSEPEARRPEPQPETQAQTPAPETRQPDPTPPAPTPAPSQPAASREGGYVAQIAAFRSREDAEAGWIAFTVRFSDITVGYAPDIQRADLGDRGVFHRLRVAAFPTREAALEFCAQLDARGQACMVRTR